MGAEVPKRGGFGRDCRSELIDRKGGVGAPPFPRNCSILHPFRRSSNDLNCKFDYSYHILQNPYVSDTDCATDVTKVKRRDSGLPRSAIVWGIYSMKYQALSFASAALALATAVPAAAQTVDFNDLAAAVSYVQNTPLTEGGYVFDATPDHQLLVWGADLAIYNPDAPGATVATQDAGSTINISRADAGVFNLVSLDFDDIYNGQYGLGGTITLTFHYAAGPDSSTAINIDDQAGLETFVFNVLGLTSFDIVGTSTRSGMFQFDNLVTGQEQQVGPGDGDPRAVPEAATWAMMLMGFGALGMTLRRRRASVTFA